MSTPFIGTTTARETTDSDAKDKPNGPPGFSFNVKLPESGSTIDEKTVFDAAYLAHEQLQLACDALPELLKKPHGTVIFLDAQLRRGLELFSVAILQLGMAVDRFAQLEAKADAELDWWKRVNTPRVEGVTTHGPKPEAADATSSGVDLVTNLLALAGSSAELSGRVVTIQDSALYSALTHAFLKSDSKHTLYTPSIFGPWGEPERAPTADGSPQVLPNSLQQAVQAAFAAQASARARVDQFVRTAAIAFGANKSNPLAIEANLRSEKLLNDFVTVNSLLQEFNLLAASKAGDASGPMELIARAAALYEKVRTDSESVSFLSVRVEQGGGTYRVVRNLLNTLSGGDGISLRAGVILSYAQFDFAGKLVAAGLIPMRSNFEAVSPPATAATWKAIAGVFLVAIVVYLVTLRLTQLWIR